MENQVVNHCKKQYEVIVPYSENGTENGLEVIKVNEILYNVYRLPRPAKNETDLWCVIVNNVRYRSLANFLKSLKK